MNITKIKCNTVDFYQHVRIPTISDNHPTTTRVSDDYNLTKDLGIVVYFIPEWCGVLLESDKIMFPVFVNASNVKNMFLEFEKKAEIADNSSLPQAEKPLVKTIKKKKGSSNE